MTHFIPQAHTGNCVSYNTIKKYGEELEKMMANGPWR